MLRFRLLHILLTTSAAFLICQSECPGQTELLPGGSRSNASIPGPAAPTDWPRFRGPGGMGVSDAANLPVTWGDPDNIAWKAALPGAGASSPIVVKDRIYVTCYTGYFVPGEPRGSLDQLQRHLLCLSLRDGSEVWRRTVAARLPEEEQIRDHGYAANTPVADDDSVYVFFGRSGVSAFAHDGTPQWNADVGSATSGWSTAASLVLHNDLLIVNASVESESLIAVDRTTGKERWRVPGIRESWNTPLVVRSNSGRSELIVAVHGTIHAYNPDTGEPLWTCDTDISWYMVPSVVEAGGIVYALGGRSGTAALAVRTGGQGDVTATHRLWTSIKGSNVTSPVVRNGYLYWVHEKLGIAYCAGCDSGELVYEERLGRCDQVYASTLLAGNRVYHLDRSGRMFVLAATPQYELLSINTLSDGSLFNATPAVVGNQLLLRSDRYLYCIGSEP